MIGDFLLDQLNELRQSGTLCDLELLSAEGAIFPVHALVFTCLNIKHFENAHRKGDTTQLFTKKKMVLSKLSTGEVNSLVDFLYGKSSFSKMRYTQLKKGLTSLSMSYLLEKVDIIIESDESADIVKYEDCSESVLTSEDNRDHSVTVHSECKNIPCFQVTCHSRETSYEREIKTEITETTYDRSDETSLCLDGDMLPISNYTTENDPSVVKEEHPLENDVSTAKQNQATSHTLIQKSVIDKDLDLNDSVMTVMDHHSSTNVCSKSDLSKPRKNSLNIDGWINTNTQNTACTITAKVTDIIDSESCVEILDAAEQVQSDRSKDVSNVSIRISDNTAPVQNPSDNLEHERSVNTNEVINLEHLKKLEQSITDKVNTVLGATDAISQMISSLKGYSKVPDWSQCIEKAKNNMTDVTCMTGDMRQSLLMSELVEKTALDKQITSQSASCHKDKELEAGLDTVEGYNVKHVSSNILPIKSSISLLSKSYNKQAPKPTPDTSCTTTLIHSSTSVPISSVIPYSSSPENKTSDDVTTVPVSIKDSLSGCCTKTPHCAILNANKTQSENAQTSFNDATSNDGNENMPQERCMQNERKVNFEPCYVSPLDKCNEEKRGKNVLSSVNKNLSSKLAHNNHQKVKKKWPLQRQNLKFKKNLNTKTIIYTDNITGASRRPSIVQTKKAKEQTTDIASGRLSVFDVLQSIQTNATTVEAKQSVCPTSPTHAYHNILKSDCISKKNPDYNCSNSSKISDKSRIVENKPIQSSKSKVLRCSLDGDVESQMTNIEKQGQVSKEEDFSPAQDEHSNNYKPTVNQRTDTHKDIVCGGSAGVRPQKATHPFLRNMLNENVSSIDNIDNNIKPKLISANKEMNKKCQSKCTGVIVNDTSLSNMWKKQMQDIQDTMTNNMSRQLNDMTSKIEQETKIITEENEENIHNNKVVHVSENGSEGKDHNCKKKQKSYSEAKESKMQESQAKIVLPDRVLCRQQEPSIVNKDWKSYYQYAYSGRTILPKVSLHPISWSLVPSSTTETNQAVLVPNNSIGSPGDKTNISPNRANHGKRKRHRSTGSLNVNHSAKFKKQKQLNTSIDMMKAKQDQDIKGCHESELYTCITKAAEISQQDCEQADLNACSSGSVKESVTAVLSDDEDSLPLSKISTLLKCKNSSPRQDSWIQNDNVQLAEPLVNDLSEEHEARLRNTPVLAKEIIDLTKNEKAEIDTTRFGIHNIILETPVVKKCLAAQDSPEIARLLSAKVYLSKSDDVYISENKTNKKGKIQSGLKNMDLNTRINSNVQTHLTEKDAIATVTNLNPENVIDVDIISAPSESLKENSELLVDNTEGNKYKTQSCPILANCVTTQQSKLEYQPQSTAKDVLSHVTPKVIMKKRPKKCSKAALVSPQSAHRNHSNNENLSTNQSENVLLYKIDENSTIHAKSMF